MVRTHIIPSSNNIQVAIPDNYIGKSVEVTIVAEEDLQEVKPTNEKGNISRFMGIISKERAAEIQKFAEEIRNEWDRNI